MMEQYWLIKNDYPNTLLFYRMGDFYELFHDDAVIAANELNIALTRRGKADGLDIPMCGVPYHSSEGYLAKLIQKGHRVAICEQMESPEDAKKRGHKGPLRRGVVRIVTPGTLTEDSLLASNRNNFLVTLSPLLKDSSSKIGIATIDVSTGDFIVESIECNDLQAHLARIEPSEIVMADVYYCKISDSHVKDEDDAQVIIQKAIQPYFRSVTPLPLVRFNHQNGKQRLLDFFSTETLDVFGPLPLECITAAGAALDYLSITQKESMPRLSYPKYYFVSHTLHIDAATRKSLELTQTQGGMFQGSFLHTIDNTVTAMGARLLGTHVAAPLLDIKSIQKRLDQVTFFYDHFSFCKAMREILTHCPDGERALSRLLMNRGGPRDMGIVCRTLRCGIEIARLLEASESPINQTTQKWASRLSLGNHLLVLLEKALSQNHLPFLTRDGGFIAEGFDEALDRSRHLQQNGKSLIESLQTRYITETGITTLKIKHNFVLGYHIDISPSHIQKIPEEFIHRQTLSTSYRYTTVALSELEKEMTQANETSLSLEISLFESLLTALRSEVNAITNIFKIIANLDVLCSHATLAHSHEYSRPIVDDSMELQIQQGRHPVVEQVLKKAATSTPFAANACLITDQKKFWLMTGPNMGGKSTYLRQNALIVIMAQMGMYVPALSAHIGYVDRLSSRVGAFDDLAAGRSTFMVEMIETAAILHQSTKRSFVILDEIGRGTATYDGLSIALAVTEHLCSVIQCRALFATHYHELTACADRLPTLGCLTVKVESFEDDIVFLHKVHEGVADRSYGVQVAARAGLPKSVIKRSFEILETLEKPNVPINMNELKHDPAAPSQPKGINTHQNNSMLEDTIINADLNAMTPKDALDFLYILKSKLEKPKAA